jgi:hypothetical protein
VTAAAAAVIEGWTQTWTNRSRAHDEFSFKEDITFSMKIEFILIQIGSRCGKRNRCSVFDGGLTSCRDRGRLL